MCGNTKAKLNLDVELLRDEMYSFECNLSEGTSKAGCQNDVVVVNDVGFGSVVSRRSRTVRSRLHRTTTVVPSSQLCCIISVPDRMLVFEK